MSELKRYALVGWRAFPDPDGDWVFHESARAALDSLKAQLTTEREAHARTVAALEECLDALDFDNGERPQHACQDRARAAIAAAKVTP